MIVEFVILKDVKFDMSIVKEELFGLVVCIMLFEMEDEVVSIVNVILFGLSGVVYMVNVEWGVEFVKWIEIGMIYVNDMIINDELNVVFGGEK